MATVVNPAGTIERDSLDAIKTFLSGTLAEFVSADAAKRMANDDAKLAGDKQTGARESVLTKLAARAHAADWQESDIKTAIAGIVESYKANDDKKASSVATFKNDIMHATNYKVRGHVATIFRVTREAFDAEGAAVKDIKDAAQKKALTPIRNAFARSYHTAAAVFAAIPKTSNLKIETPRDVVNFASETLKAKRFDAKRVKARLGSIRAELEAFYGDFPVDGISVCTEFLSEVTEKQLAEAHAERARQLDAEDDSEPEAVEPVEPEVVPATMGDARDAALADVYGVAA